MIGGYVYRERDERLEGRITARLGATFVRIPVREAGYLFHDEPFQDRRTASSVSEDVVAVSQDLLVAPGEGGEYRALDLAAEFVPRFRQYSLGALDAISSDFRMAVASRRGTETTVLLVSQRAGSGRMYYHAAKGGIVFSSDLRFLLGVVGCEVSPIAIYANLKYGAIPEPMTISANVRAVPPAHALTYGVGAGAQRTAPFFKLRFDCDNEPRSGRSDDELLAPAKAALRRSARFLAPSRPVMLLSGGIDSSLYGCYLHESGGGALRSFYCAFGGEDPEREFAERIAGRIGAELDIARMETPDALAALDEAARLTDHPFADFSSLPIAFLLKHARERAGASAPLVECNGGDDCFGFGDLGNESKFAMKHRFPARLKRALSLAMVRFPHWKWESHEGLLARLSALADVHEATALNYFLVVAPVAYLGLRAAPEWDGELAATLEEVFSACAENGERLGYPAKTTIRQLMHVNSRRWAAKALSVGESLGIRVVYPYLWREILVEQGKIPWDAKIRDGVVKWPLKKLLEEFMPPSFIYRKKSGFVPPFARWLAQGEFNRRAREVLLDPGAAVALVVPSRVLEELLSDAAQGRKLRHSVLNFLWGALFTELWLREHGRG